MSDVRTTIALREDLYLGVKSRYRELGFTRMADLINEAISVFLHKSQLEDKHRAMELAAADPAYTNLLKRVSADFEFVDAEGFSEDY